MDDPASTDSAVDVSAPSPDSETVAGDVVEADVAATACVHDTPAPQETGKPKWGHALARRSPLRPFHTLRARAELQCIFECSQTFNAERPYNRLYSQYVA